MTERERYRTLGSYYLTVTGNYLKAIDNYQLLLEKYPADNAGRNNMAVAYFYTLQFDEALKQGAELVETHPRMPAYRANYALYAMYAGKFPRARDEAISLLELDPAYFLGYVPLAIAEMADGNLAAAREVYQRMGKQGIQAASSATTGLADIALLIGDWQRAAELLSEGIRVDLESGNKRAAAHKGIYLAYARVELGEREAALRALDTALQSSQAVSHLLPAARLLVDMGERERAESIRQQLDSRLQRNSWAAADIIAADLALAAGNIAAGVDALNTSIAHTDSWLARCSLGRTYALAGYHAEALGELEQCEDRIGESTAVFLDDIPTFHYSAPLYYWLGLTRQQLGMPDAARQDYTRYLSLRVDSDQSEMSRNARERLAELSQ
jgi:tetratricopeptide (TPR) repeat protein